MLLHQVLQFAEALHVTVGELVPSPIDLPQILASETRIERDAYLKKLRKMASGPNEEEGQQ